MYVWTYYQLQHRSVMRKKQVLFHFQEVRNDWESAAFLKAKHCHISFSQSSRFNFLLLEGKGVKGNSTSCCLGGGHPIMHATHIQLLPPSKHIWKCLNRSNPVGMAVFQCSCFGEEELLPYPPSHTLSCYCNKISSVYWCSVNNMHYIIGLSLETFCPDLVSSC